MVPNLEDVRANAALCFVSLVSGNRVSREAAKAAGAVECIATLLDGGAEWEGAYLAAMSMQALGLQNEREQERALSPQKASRTSVKEKEVARTGVLREVWALKEEPERWRRR